MSAVEEIRRAIDHQVQAGSGLDTKLTALVTVIGTVAGLGAARLDLTTPDRLAAFGLTAVLMGASVLSALSGLRPRATHFGAEPESLVARVAVDAPEIFQKELVFGLHSAYSLNQGVISTKADRYEIALWLFFLTLLTIAPLLATGALA